MIKESSTVSNNSDGSSYIAKKIRSISSFYKKEIRKEVFPLNYPKYRASVGYILKYLVTAFDNTNIDKK
jgi:hypothetical protein